jgi:hypothetical protein
MSWMTLKNPLFSFGPDDDFAKYHLDFTNKAPPQDLFHYTSEENLLNIIKSGTLWATECTFLNDESEFNSGVDIFREACEKFHDKLFIDAFTAVLKSWDDNSWMCFVISLSEHGDLLSQWRAYANNGTGCSIGLDTNCIRDRAGFGELVRINADQLPHDTTYFYHLLKVIYTKDEKETIATQFLRHAKQLFDSHRNEGGLVECHSLKLFILIVSMRIREFLISFKNEDFSEEREWRIVSLLHKDDPAIEFRHTSYGLAPYTKINLSPRVNIIKNKLPLIGLILGPRSKTKSNTKGVNLFLSRMDHELNVSTSKCTYR